MSLIRSFHPLESPEARVLILGSMPGEASLRLQQYYAHPRNAFWHIMAGFSGVGPEDDYEQRVAGLAASGIALWDVLRSCERPGSLDAAIREHTVVPNDFTGFFRRHGDLCLVCFNGAKAEQAFRKHVFPGLARAHAKLAFQRLPSTSPAHAALTLDQKRRAWHSVLAPVLARSAGKGADAAAE